MLLLKDRTIKGRKKGDRMASVASIGSKLIQIIKKSEMKPSNDNQQTKRLYSKWEGKAQTAFKGAYKKAPDLCEEIKTQAENAKRILSSLNNAMEEAERDIKEKKEKSRRR